MSSSNKRKFNADSEPNGKHRWQKKPKSSRQANFNGEPTYEERKRRTWAEYERFMGRAEGREQGWKEGWKEGLKASKSRKRCRRSSRDSASPFWEEFWSAHGGFSNEDKRPEPEDGASEAEKHVPTRRKPHALELGTSTFELSKLPRPSTRATCAVLKMMYANTKRIFVSMNSTFSLTKSTSSSIKSTCYNTS